MATQQIVRGIMVTFDVFSKTDIENINTKVSKTFEVEPSIKKSALFGSSSETKNFVWTIESLPKLFSTLRNFCDEESWKGNLDLMPKYIENFQVWGYDSPNFPFYILMVKIFLKKTALISGEELRKDLFQVSIASRLFIESLKGFRKSLTTFSPSSPLVIQLWVKVDKEELTRMREIEIALVDKEEKLSLDQKKKLSKELRSLEPIDLSAPTGDLHSHILCFSNVTYVLGHTTQLGLGGLFTPYILYLSYDENLLHQDLIETHLAPAEMLIGSGIVLSGYAHLVGLISLLVYLYHLVSEGEKIDQETSELRNIIAQKTISKTLNQQLLEINGIGIRISSLQQTVGRFSRYWEGSIRRTSESKPTLYLEVPVQNEGPFALGATAHKGYQSTLVEQTLTTLDNIKGRLEKQGLEVAALTRYISDRVNLEIVKINETLQRARSIQDRIMAINALFKKLTNQEIFKIDVPSFFIELPISCKNNIDFKNKIENICCIFDIELNGLRSLISSPDSNWKSRKLLKEWLKKEKEITNYTKTVNVWDKICYLRSMPPTHPKLRFEHIEIMNFFGGDIDNLPQLWENILDSFIDSLNEFYKMLKSL